MHFSSLIPNFLLGTMESASGVGGPALVCGRRGRVVVGGQQALSRGEKMVRVKGLYAVEQQCLLRAEC